MSKYDPAEPLPPNIWSGGCRATPAIRLQCSSDRGDTRDLCSAGSPHCRGKHRGVALSARAVLRRAVPLLRLQHHVWCASYEPIDGLCRLLEREIGLVAAHLRGRIVTHLHWGGGTPTMLRPRHIAREIMAELAHGIRLSRRTLKSRSRSIRAP